MFHQHRNTDHRLIVDPEDMFSDKLLRHLLDHALPRDLETYSRTSGLGWRRKRGHFALALPCLLYMT